jgi:hypothetical protein
MEGEWATGAVVESRRWKSTWVGVCVEKSAILCQQLSKAAFNTNIYEVDDAQACPNNKGGESASATPSSRGGF